MRLYPLKTGLLIGIVLPVLLSFAGCYKAFPAETSTIAQSSKITVESTDTTEPGRSTVSSDTDPIESSASLRPPMNPLTADDFRAVCKNLQYSVRELTPLEGSNEVALLRSSSGNNEYYLTFSKFSDEECAKERMRERYDSLKRGEEEAGPISEISFSEMEGYDIIVAKDEKLPSYTICLRVNTVIIEAYCFSTKPGDIGVINDFFTFFGYVVEGSG